MSGTVLITGANRGIGLAMTQICRQRGDTVYAVCRKASDELKQTGAEVIEGIDVSKPGDVERLAKRMQGVTLDSLINNAGILKQESLDAMDFAAVEEQFVVNALGPLRVTHALLGNLKAGGKVGLVTSRMGSIADNGSGGYYGYRMSKAALNAAGKSLANDLKSREISVAILHPGFVATGMTGYSGNVPPGQAAEGLLARLDELTPETSGTFWHAGGEVLPW